MNPPLTMRALIDARAAQYPDTPFLLAAPEGDESSAAATRTDTLTFAGLRDDCRTLEARFRRAGLRPGDVVSVFMGNGIQTARLLLAAMYSGLVANPLNLLCQPSQLRYIVEHSDTRMIFAGGDTHDAIAAAITGLHEQGLGRAIAFVQTEADGLEPPASLHTEPALAEVAVSAAMQPAAPPRDYGPWSDDAPVSAYEPNADDVALLMYTSGTTGAPKGVLLSHRNLLANARNITAEHRLDAADRVLASLPLYHINGLVVTLIAPLFHGGSVVMTPRFSARTFWRDVGALWLHVDQRGADDRRLSAQQRRAVRVRSVGAEVLPQRVGGAACRSSPRVRGALWHRHHRNHGHDRNGRSRIQ